MKIYYRSTDNEITLFWEKEEGAVPGDIYKVKVGDVGEFETAVTHITIKDLAPDTEYTAEVVFKGEKASLSVKTLKKQEFIDITKAPYFASCDGKTLNTASIQKALDDCREGQAVYIPKGVFLSGGLFMHSCSALYLDEGAVLQGTSDPKDYLPMIKSRFEGMERHCYQSLINMGELDHDAGPNCENILIYGKGSILGGGRELMDNTINEERERLIKEGSVTEGSEYEKSETVPGRARGRLINISNCRNVRISGLTVGMGPAWNIHMIYSENIVTDNCTIVSRDIWNGDGWDPDSSENCFLFGCRFDTGDDAVAVKSGKNPEGNLIGRPCRHVCVFDCTSLFGHGFAIGSEMSGGIEDVHIWDCDFSHSAYGVQIKGTKKRGAYIKNVRVENCILSRILAVSVPYNDDGEGSEVPPVFRDFSYRDITVTGLALNEQLREYFTCNPIELRGFDDEEHFIENVLLKNIRIVDQPADIGELDMWFDDGISRGHGAILVKNCRNVTIEGISNIKKQINKSYIC